MIAASYPSANGISAVVFDAYGTLFDVHSVRLTGEQFFPGQGMALSQLWRTKQLEYTWLRSLMQRYEDFSVVTRDSLRYACSALHVACSAEQEAALLAAYRHLATYPEVPAVLNELAGRPLAILSNGEPEMLAAVVDTSGLREHFAAIISVHAAGVFKPDPRVYQLAVDALRLPAGNIAFISANGWDAAGGAAFGFKAFWVNRGKAPIEELPGRPTATMADLSGLSELLNTGGGETR